MLSSQEYLKSLQSLFGTNNNERALGEKAIHTFATSHP